MHRPDVGAAWLLCDRHPADAVVVLRGDAAPSDELARELQLLVKERYAAHAYPRSVRFVPSLPKTESGKIQRVVLRRERVAALQAFFARRSTTHV